MNAIEKSTFKRESILCGVSITLIIIALVIVFLKNQMNPQQTMAICFLFALGSAGFLVFLPGFLALTGAVEPKAWLQKLEFKAGGGAAIFILAFLILHHSLSQ